MCNKLVFFSKCSSRERSSNIELLRIITMLLIIAHHYVVNSGLSEVMYRNPFTSKAIFLFLFGAWGKIGINCFVLITGYFMCKSNITLKKFCSLIGQIMFYKIVIFILFLISGIQIFSFSALISGIIPFTTIANNFTGTYLVFFLCIPFLNVLIKNLGEKQHIYLIILSTLIYVLFGTLPFLSVTMNYVSWYIVLYFIASYIRLYPKKIFDSTKICGLCLATCILLSTISVLCCVWIGLRINRSMAYYFVTDSNTLLALLTGLFAFLYFKNIKIKYNKIINMLGASTFGVLLIHASSDAMRNFLWRDLLDNVHVYDTSWIFIHAIVSVVGIFLICTIIDIIRKEFVKRFIQKRSDEILVKIATWYKDKENIIIEKFRIDSSFMEGKQ